MSTATLAMPYHPGRGAPARTTRSLSGATWARIRRAVTIGLFVLATAAGIVIGVTAPEISPVAPAIASGPVPAPAEAIAPTPVSPDGRFGPPDGHPGGARGHR
jgi:hypothetical protein